MWVPDDGIVARLVEMSRDAGEFEGIQYDRGWWADLWDDAKWWWTIKRWGRKPAPPQTRPIGPGWVRTVVGERGLVLIVG